VIEAHGALHVKGRGEPRLTYPFLGRTGQIQRTASQRSAGSDTSAALA